MKRIFWEMLIICVLTLLAYSNIFYNGRAVDDAVFVGRYHPTVAEAFRGAVPPGHEGVYRPIRGLLYTAYFNVFGTNLFFYHLHSLIVHLASTVLVFLIIKKLIGNWKLEIGNYSSAPFFGALLFGLHPIHTETITYIASSIDATGLLLFFLSWYLYLRKHPLWSLCIATVAFFTTEMALTLPLLLVLYELTLGEGVRTPSAGSDPADVVRTLRNAMTKIWPYFVAAGSYITLRFFILGIGARGVYLADSFYLTMLTMSKVLVRYLWLLIFPINLMHNHIISPGIEAFVYRGYRTAAIASQTILDPEILGSIGMIGGIVLIGWKMRKNHPLISFGIGVYFLGLLPVMEFIPQGSMMNERSLYISSIGFVLITAYGLEKFVETWRIRNMGIICIIGAMSLTYGVRTYLRNMDWRDDVTIFTKDISAAPKENAYAYFALGNAYAAKKDSKNAAESYQKSVDINPGFAVGYASLWRVFQDLGDTAQAGYYYQKAAAAEPGFWERP